jgi:hypothetical protein
MAVPVAIVNHTPVAAPPLDESAAFEILTVQVADVMMLALLGHLGEFVVAIGPPILSPLAHGLVVWRLSKVQTSRR